MSMTRPIPTVEQFMTRLPHTVEPTTSVASAHDLMKKFQVRHLPVVRDEQIVGLISLRDVQLVESLDGVDEREVAVADAMESDPYVVHPNTPLNDVAANMASRRIGSAIVTTDGTPTGIFTTVDALVALLHIWKEAP